MFTALMFKKKMILVRCLLILLGILLCVQSQATIYHPAARSRLHSSMTSSSPSFGNLHDHVIPDKCGGLRRTAYKGCLSATVICGTAAGACAAFWIGYPICVAVLCIPPTAVCSGAIGTYNDCCNHMKADPKHGWTVAELRNAALCGSCMSKSDVIKPICNQ